MGYSHEFSNFPNVNIDKKGYKNIDNSIASLVNTINSLRRQGLYNAAQELITANESLLSEYIVDATTFRRWEEEIYNTQLYAKQQQQVIFFDEEEPECSVMDVWIGGT